MASDGREEVSLRFVVNDSNTKGSCFTCREMVQRSVRRPREGCCVVIPRRFAVRARGALIRVRPKGKVLGVSVLDFRHLTCHMFRRANKSGEGILRSAKGDVILRGVIRRREGRLTCLKDRVGGPKCLSRIGSLISRFVRCSVERRGLTRVGRGTGSRPLLRVGLGSIKVLCRSFERFLGKRCVAKRRIVSILLGRLPFSRGLGKTRFLFSKFAKFAPVRIGILERLLIVTSHVDIAIAVSRQRSTFSPKGPCRLFFVDGRVVQALTKLAESLRSPICLGPSKRSQFTRTPTLRFLRGGVFHCEGNICTRRRRRVGVFATPSPLRRVQRTTEEVSRLIHAYKCHCNRVTIVAKGLRRCTELTTRMFRRTSVPCFVSRGRSMVVGPFIRCLHTTVRVTMRKFPCRDIFHCLEYKVSRIAERRTSGLRGCILTLKVQKCGG